MAKLISERDMEIGERIRACREGRGLTREELASVVYNLPENGGMRRSPGQIGYLERGERSLSPQWATLLSKALNVRREYLLYADDWPTVYDKEYDDVCTPFDSKNLALICDLEALTNFVSKLGYEFEPRVTYLKSDEIIALKKRIPSNIDMLTREIDAHEGVRKQLHFMSAELGTQMEFEELFENNEEYNFGKYSERSIFKLIDDSHNTIATFSGAEIISLAQEISDFAEFKIIKTIRGIQSYEND